MAEKKKIEGSNIKWNERVYITIALTEYSEYKGILWTIAWQVIKYSSLDKMDRFKKDTSYQKWQEKNRKYKETYSN